jgi:coenzyme Q-binding protein COQ10
MFDLVAAIDTYPDFLPWCTGARIRKREPGETPVGRPCEYVTADLSIRFKVFRETFVSRVMLDAETKTIVIEYLDGPFKHLENRWQFYDHEDGDGNGVRVDFYIDFEFRSRALQALIGSLFGHAVEKLMGAFEGRAARVCPK